MLAKEERREVLHDALYGFIDEVFCLDLGQPEHTRNDQVNTYAAELLSYYFLYIELEDAIAEGDGDRLIRFCSGCFTLATERTTHWRHSGY